MKPKNVTYSTYTAAAQIRLGADNVTCEIESRLLTVVSNVTNSEGYVSFRTLIKNTPGKPLILKIFGPK